MAASARTPTPTGCEERQELCTALTIADTSKNARLKELIIKFGVNYVFTNEDGNKYNNDILQILLLAPIRNDEILNFIFDKNIHGAHIANINHLNRSKNTIFHILFSFLQYPPGKYFQDSVALPPHSAAWSSLFFLMEKGGDSLHTSISEILSNTPGKHKSPSVVHFIKNYQQWKNLKAKGNTIAHQKELSKCATIIAEYYEKYGDPKIAKHYFYLALIYKGKTCKQELKKSCQQELKTSTAKNEFLEFLKTHMSKPYVCKGSETKITDTGTLIKNKEEHLFTWIAYQDLRKDLYNLPNPHFKNPHLSFIDELINEFKSDNKEDNAIVYKILKKRYLTKENEFFKIYAAHKITLAGIELKTKGPAKFGNAHRCPSILKGQENLFYDDRICNQYGFLIKFEEDDNLITFIEARSVAIGLCIEQANQFEDDKKIQKEVDHAIAIIIKISKALRNTSYTIPNDLEGLVVICTHLVQLLVKTNCETQRQSLWKHYEILEAYCSIDKDITINHLNYLLTIPGINLSSQLRTEIEKKFKGLAPHVAIPTPPVAEVKKKEEKEEKKEEFPKTATAAASSATSFAGIAGAGITGTSGTASMFPSLLVTPGVGNALPDGRPPSSTSLYPSLSLPEVKTSGVGAAVPATSFSAVKTPAAPTISLFAAQTSAAAPPPTSLSEAKTAAAAPTTSLPEAQAAAAAAPTISLSAAAAAPTTSLSEAQPAAAAPTTSLSEAQTASADEPEFTSPPAAPELKGNLIPSAPDLEPPAYSSLLEKHEAHPLSAPTSHHNFTGLPIAFATPANTPEASDAKRYTVNREDILDLIASKESQAKASEDLGKKIPILFKIAELRVTLLDFEQALDCYSNLFQEMDLSLNRNYILNNVNKIILALDQLSRAGATTKVNLLKHSIYTAYGSTCRTFIFCNGHVPDHELPPPPEASFVRKM